MSSHLSPLTSHLSSLIQQLSYLFGEEPQALFVISSSVQARAQMGMWCMLASPLIMSADLRTIRPEFKEILLNKNLIKLNQVELI